VLAGSHWAILNSSENLQSASLGSWHLRFFSLGHSQLQWEPSIRSSWQLTSPLLLTGPFSTPVRTFNPVGENRPTLESTPQRKRKRNKGGQRPKSRQASNPNKGGPQGGKGTTTNRTLHQSHGAYQLKTRPDFLTRTMEPIFITVLWRLALVLPWAKRGTFWLHAQQVGFGVEAITGTGSKKVN
jgi:hypothetical protein